MQAKQTHMVGRFWGAHAKQSGVPMPKRRGGGGGGGGVGFPTSSNVISFVLFPKASETSTNFIISKLVHYIIE